MKRTVICLLFSVFLMGCVSARKYQMKVDEADNYQLQIDDLNEKLNKLTLEKQSLEKAISDLETNNASLNEALNATTNKKDQMISELTKTKQDLEAKMRELDEERQEKEKAIASLKNTYENLVEDLKAEIKEGEIQITQLAGKLTVNMVDKILFKSGEADVTKQGETTLDKLSVILKKTKDKQIRIEGHSDNIPVGKKLKNIYPSNWELSAARATNVARYIIDKGGVNEKVIAVAGYAHTRPVASNATAEGRAKNRRIEIVLVPMDADAKNKNEKDK